MDITEHPLTTTTPNSSSSSSINSTRLPPRDSLLRRRPSRRDRESSSSAVTDDEKEDDALDDEDEESVLSDATRLTEAVRGLAVAPGLAVDSPPLDHTEQSPAVAARGDPEEAAPESLYDADDEATSVPASPVVTPLVCEVDEVDEIYKVGEGMEAHKETSAEAGKDGAAELGANSNADEKFCRICLAGADDLDESLGTLFSPCLCSGTMKYVHVECLNRWRIASRKNTSFFECDSCKYRYRFARTTWALYATNELVLTLVTLLIFALAVFLSGFLMKLLLWYMEASNPEWLLIGLEDPDPSLEVNPAHEFFTLDEVFTVDKFHMSLGLLFVGVIGFLQIMLGMWWWGPWPWGGLHNFRTTIRVGNREDRGAAWGAFVVMVVVLGSIKACWVMYKTVKRLSRSIMEVVQLAILEVNAE